MPLGPERPEIPPVLGEREIVAVRAVGGRIPARDRSSGVAQVRPTNAAGSTGAEGGGSARCNHREDRVRAIEESGRPVERRAPAPPSARIAILRVGRSMRRASTQRLGAAGSPRQRSCAGRASSEVRHARRQSRRPERRHELIEMRSTKRGHPLTSSRRSGAKTLIRGRPGRRAGGLPACRRPTSVSGRRGKPDRELMLAVERRPSGRQRASSSFPKRTRSRSLEVRKERPVQPKYSPSSRFVLPAPFGPETTVRPVEISALTSS